MTQLQGPNSPYPDDWDTRRRRVYRRDNYTCGNCGVKGGGYQDSENVELHAHHIVPISSGGTHQLDNLRTVCKDCHRAIHNKNIMAPTSTSSWYQQEAGNAARDYLDFTTREAVTTSLILFIAFFFGVGFFLGMLGFSL